MKTICPTKTLATSALLCLALFFLCPRVYALFGAQPCSLGVTTSVNGDGQQCFTFTYTAGCTNSPGCPATNPVTFGIYIGGIGMKPMDYVPTNTCPPTFFDYSVIAPGTNVTIPGSCGPIDITLSPGESVSFCVWPNGSADGCTVSNTVTASIVAVCDNGGESCTNGPSIGFQSNATMTVISPGAGSIGVVPNAQVYVAAGGQVEVEVSETCVNGGSNLVALGGTAAYGFDYVFDVDSSVKIDTADPCFAIAVFGINANIAEGIIDTFNVISPYWPDPCATVILQSGGCPVRPCWAAYSTWTLTIVDTNMIRTNISATAICGNEIFLSWLGAPSGSCTSLSYGVFRSTVSGGPFTQIGTTTNTVYKDTGLAANTTYYYEVESGYGCEPNIIPVTTIQVSATTTNGWNVTGSLDTPRRYHTATLLPDGNVLAAGGYDSDYLSSAELYNWVTGTWTNTGSLHTARTQAKAALLPSGLVLVAGGQSSSPLTTSTTELYNYQTGEWTNTGSLNTPREYSTLTLLPNGLVLAAAGLNDNGPTELSSAELYYPQTGTWSNTGSLSVARDTLTATLLPNGLVLAAGGATFSGPVTNAELYNPQTGTWTNTGALHTARDSHAATLLPNGLVLVSGGLVSSGAPTNAAELYNPNTGIWSITGSMNTARYNHSAVLLPNGQVLVGGGENSSGEGLDESEVYDPFTGTWTVECLLNNGRFGQSETLLPDGDVLTEGGNSGSSSLASAELYSFALTNDTGWAGTGSLNTSRSSHTATLLADEMVLVAGGYDTNGYLTSAELYDTSNETWSATGSLNTARGFHTATLLPSGEVLVAGGYDSSGVLTSSELYSVSAGAWASTSCSLNTGRFMHTATLLPNGSVVVAGGFGASGCLASSEIYNSTASTWTTTGSMNVARYEHTATLLPDGQVLVAGGEGSSSNYLASAELYNPSNGIWSLTGSLNTARNYHTATLLPSGLVLVSGGCNSSGAISSAELYNSSNGTWVVTGALNYARESHTATLLPNDMVLVVGGCTTNSFLYNAELYNPLNGTNGAWAVTFPLNITTSAQTATLLPNGSVLLAGGIGTNGYISNAELYGQ